MSAKERIRLDALSRVKRREIPVTHAATLMNVSLRQARRLWKRFNTGGDKALLHRSRGRPSNRRISQEQRDRIVQLYTERYHDFGPTLACEKLRQDGLVVSPDTLTAILKDRELYIPCRKRKAHRRRRERRACFGELIQIDGSHHDWFEARGGWCVLMVMVDDATGWTYARFYRAETTEAAFDLFGRWVKRYGVPREIYSDRHSIYRNEEDRDKPTQFGRAMEELSVKLICANSPQAKGRVERRHGVFQDRLVKAMRLKDVSTLEAANRYLDEEFLEALNARFHVEARSPANVHRRVPRGLKLEHVLCYQEERVVQNDWTVSWCNRVLQLGARHQKLGLARKRIMVSELLDGTLRLTYGVRELEWQELVERPTRARREAKPKPISKRQSMPAANHPWRRRPAVG